MLLGYLRATGWERGEWPRGKHVLKSPKCGINRGGFSGAVMGTSLTHRQIGFKTRPADGERDQSTQTSVLLQLAESSKTNIPPHTYTHSTNNLRADCQCKTVGI